MIGIADRRKGMFIYVFSEADSAKMRAAGFTFVCRDAGANAWVFLADTDGSHTLPDGLESVVTSRMTFHGETGKQHNGGGRHGQKNASAL